MWGMHYGASWQRLIGFSYDQLQHLDACGASVVPINHLLTSFPPSPLRCPVSKVAFYRQCYDELILATSVSHPLLGQLKIAAAAAASVHDQLVIFSEKAARSSMVFLL